MHRDGQPDSPDVHGRRDPTALLLAWSHGDQAAFDELIPLIHDELHRIARRHMRGASNFSSRDREVGMASEAPTALTMPKLCP
jgi:hypothetical protein